MPKNGRPPMKAAREHAIRMLIDAYPDEYEGHMEGYLNGAGWEHQIDTVTRWVHNGAAGPKES